MRIVSWCAVAVSVSGCSGGGAAGGPATTTATAEVGTDPTADPATTTASATDAVTDAVTVPAADIVVRTGVPGTPIDRRVFGSNLPAWLGPERLADPGFRRLVVDAGVTTVRMPGGSWSNGYDWRACEEGDSEQCPFVGAARPSDFAGFLAATGLEGMWTVSINETAQSAAAAVAFFNGSVDDPRPIGTDRDGVDWGTVGRWAELRAARGSREPIGITLWEVGNEVYGGRPDAGGDQCAAFGWEEVWTCDGTEYVAGDGEHDGYLAIRDAMVAVDPTIEVGAVGVPDPSSWSEWGDEVIAAAGEALDFYVVHDYGFDASPDVDEALELPAQRWPQTLDGLRGTLPADVPIAVTEYNLVSFESGDTERTMTTALNALYLADTLGQLVTLGVPIANHWNLANGTTGSGTDYGLIDLEGGVFPAYAAFEAWSATGDTLLAVDVDADDDVRVHATRHSGDGRLAVVVINASGDAHDVRLAVDDAAAAFDGTLTVRAATSPDSDTMPASAPRDADLAAGGSAPLALPPWSISVWEARPDA